MGRGTRLRNSCSQDNQSPSPVNNRKETVRAAYYKLEAATRSHSGKTQSLVRKAPSATKTAWVGRAHAHQDTAQAQLWGCGWWGHSLPPFLWGGLWVWGYRL